MLVRIFELNANSVDPDQSPRSAASELGLPYLPMSFLWDARHKWVNIQMVLFMPWMWPFLGILIYLFPVDD